MRHDLGRAFLLSLAKRTGIEVEDLLANYSRLESQGVTRAQLKTLIHDYNRHRAKPSAAGENVFAAAAVH